MDLFLFSGFLGSGKTTLIMALARELAAQGRRTAFVVNEVGEVGVDQQIMRGDGLKVCEITAGCICCQLGTDLVKTLAQLADQEHPETVIVEASGVATPAGITDALSYYRGPSFARTRSVGVLDPTRLEALLEVMTPLIESQVAGVEELIVTKTDEANDREIGLARTTIERLNPGAPVSMISALDALALAELATALLGERVTE